jgi:hypothetical protein
MALSSLNLALKKARGLQTARQAFLNQLLVPTTTAATPDANTPILNEIANSFSRFAAYQQTAFDTGIPRSSSTNDASFMSKQVQSAIAKVLGRGTAGGQSFVAALNSTFPTVMSSDGPLVISTPSRSLVSLNQPGNTSNGSYTQVIDSSATTTSNGYAGTLSARQANLYREASIIANDGSRVLAGLTPYSPDAELDEVESLRTIIREEINALVTEFGRVDEPREARVSAYFSALGTSLADFRLKSFLGDPNHPPITVDDESQVASLDLLFVYQDTLLATWNAFLRSSNAISLSKFVERANILLPVVAQANYEFKAAMDSVDFPESERRSLANRLSALGNSNLLLDITVYDLTEWVERYASFEGPSILADSGQYGFNLITDQANLLFTVIGPVVTIIQSNASLNVTRGTRLIQVFSNERVQFALNSLLTELHNLAGLGLIP